MSAEPHALASFALLERPANVEPERVLLGRMQERVAGRHTDDPDEIVVEAREPLPLLIAPDDVGVGGGLEASGAARHFAFLAIVRMNCSIGIAGSVSIDRVPRAPRFTDTRAMTSLSFASMMFTKS